MLYCIRNRKLSLGNLYLFKSVKCSFISYAIIYFPLTLLPCHKSTELLVKAKFGPPFIGIKREAVCDETIISPLILVITRLLKFR